MHLGVAVDLGRRGQQDLGLGPLGQAQHVDRPDHGGLGRLHRVALVEDRRGRAREVVDLVDLDVQREGHVVPHDLEARVVAQVREVGPRPGVEVVHDQDLVTRRPAGGATRCEPMNPAPPVTRIRRSTSRARSLLQSDLGHAVEATPVRCGRCATLAAVRRRTRIAATPSRAPVCSDAPHEAVDPDARVQRGSNPRAGGQAGAGRRLPGAASSWSSSTTAAPTARATCTPRGSRRPAVVDPPQGAANEGKGAAIRKAAELATGDYVIIVRRRPRVRARRRSRRCSSRSSTARPRWSTAPARSAATTPTPICTSWATRASRPSPTSSSTATSPTSRPASSCCRSTLYRGLRRQVRGLRHGGRAHRQAAARAATGRTRSRSPTRPAAGRQGKKLTWRDGVEALFILVARASPPPGRPSGRSLSAPRTARLRRQRRTCRPPPPLLATVWMYRATFFDGRYPGDEWRRALDPRAARALAAGVAGPGGHPGPALLLPAAQRPGHQ